MRRPSPQRTFKETRTVLSSVDTPLQYRYTTIYFQILVHQHNAISPLPSVTLWWPMVVKSVTFHCDWTNHYHLFLGHSRYWHSTTLPLYRTTSNTMWHHIFLFLLLLPIVWRNINTDRDLLRHVLYSTLLVPPDFNLITVKNEQCNLTLLHIIFFSFFFCIWERNYCTGIWVRKELYI